MMSEISDQELLSQITSKDLNSFKLFMLRYEERVYNFVMRIVKVPELAEEITQDTFLKIWENAGSMQEVKSAGAWLHTISKNQSLNILKQMAARYLREENYQAALPVTSEEDATTLDFRNLLHTFASQLPPKRREIFILKIQKDLSNEEIGAYLNISPHTVRSQLQKSYMVIRKLMAEDMLLVISALILAKNFF